MNVNFYNIQKRQNSTKLPTGGGVVNCTLKDRTSRLNPEIRLVWSGSSAPTYNYAYINDFRRYYWVTDWIYEDRQWTARLRVDVLASYKAAIGSSTKYILRAATAYNVHVLDNRYPATGVVGGQVKQANFGWQKYGTAGGNAVVTIVGDNTVPAGNYVGQAQMPVGNVQFLINNLLNRITSEINSAQDPSFGVVEVLKELVKIPSRMTDNLLKYVTNIMWFPFAFPTTAATANLKAGIHEVLSYEAFGWVSQPVNVIQRSIITSDWTGLGDDWEYANPYTTYILHFMPFGDIPIDSFDVLNSASIDLDVNVDAISGIAVLNIYSNPGGEQLPRLLTSRSAQLGVKLPYGGSEINIAGIVQGAAGVAASAASYISGNAGAGAIIGAVSNAAALSTPTGYASGASGTGASIDGIASLWRRRFAHVDLDVAENGKPLCKVRTINTLSGYIECRDGEIVAPQYATSAELAEIASFLTGGFFYE